MSHRPTLSVRRAYRLWAPTYGDENAVSALEDRVVRGLTPSLDGLALLDAACGTGRRLPGPGSGVAWSLGVDLVPEMLARGREDGRTAPLLVADIRALPLRGDLFDLVWCRLALGHLRRPDPVYRELARVSRRGARLVVSDFHADAIAAGHVRTFRDRGGALHRVEHHVHTAQDHERAAGAAGWRMELSVDAPAGEPERSFYAGAGRLEQWERERGLPLVLALRFVR